MIRYPTVGHLDPEVLRKCAAVATWRSDETTVRRSLPEFTGINAERKDCRMDLQWHELGRVGVPFADRLRELTCCLIADRRNGRLIEPEASSGKNRTAVQAFSEVNSRI